MGHRGRSRFLTTDTTWSAPTRVDLAGGTLDIWPVNLLLPSALTVNVAISLRARARARPAPRWRVVSENRVDLRSDRLETLFEDPLTTLAARLLHHFDPETPREVRFETTAPPGSGLGGSSSLGIAIAGALNEATGAGRTIPELARIVMDTEVRILRTATGAQDQFAAALGGANALHWESPSTRAESLPWGRAGDDPMVERFVLVFTGEAHASGNSNARVLRRIFAGKPGAVAGIERIAKAALDMREAVLVGDWSAAAHALNEEWAGRKALARRVTNPTMDRIEAALREAGALAVKACGAGAGGTMVALADPASRPAVARAATEAGGQVLDVRTATEGLRQEPGF